jgi:hypothetical protein
MTELQKSISAYLYERIASPLWGTFVVSWSVWNWRIFYVTFFVSEQIIPNKIDYIVGHHNSIIDMLVIPITSTALIICVVPFLSNGAYWVTIEFEKWRHNKKQKVDGERLLTVAQSAEIRRQIAEADLKLDQALEAKDKDIKGYIEGNGVLSRELESLKSSLGVPGVVAATYGTLARSIDVTDRLKKAFEISTSVKASHEWLGISDPDEGQSKVLSVFYRTKAGDFKLVSAREGETIGQLG